MILPVLRCPDCRLPIKDFVCPICKRDFRTGDKPYLDFLPVEDYRSGDSEFTQMPDIFENFSRFIGARKVLSEYDITNIEKTNLKLFQSVKRHEGLRVLEIGAGRGYFCRLFTTKYTANYYCALEYEQSNLNYGLRLGNFQNASQLFRGSVYSLPFEDRQFDLVVISEVLEHLSELDLAMGEIRRVLDPNGWAIASVPNSILYMYPYPILITLLQSIHHLGDQNDDKGFRLLVRRFRRLANDNLQGTYHRPFFPSQFAKLFKNHGFSIENHVSSMLTYFWDPALTNFADRYPNSSAMMFFSKVAINISDRLLQSRLPIIRYSGIRQHILARKRNEMTK